MTLSAPLKTGRISRANFWWSQGVALLTLFLSNTVIGALIPVLGEPVMGVFSFLVTLAILYFQIKWYVCRARDFGAPGLLGVLALLLTPLIVPIIVMGSIPGKKQKMEGTGKVSSDDLASPAITDLEFDTSGFNLTEDQENNRYWVTPSGEGVMVYLQMAPPPFPFGKETMQEFYSALKKDLASQNAMLIEYDTRVLDGHRALVYIFCTPNNEIRKTVFGGDICISFKDHYYHCRILCKEDSPTGVRESMAVIDALVEGRVNLDPMPESISAAEHDIDPYDRKHDERTPYHALSRVRQLIDHIFETGSVSDKLDSFEKPDWPRDVES